MTKRCTKCDEHKPREEFTVLRRGSKGQPILRAECKLCERRYRRGWEQRNRTKRNAQRRRLNADNPEAKAAANARAWAKLRADPEALAIRNAQRRARRRGTDVYEHAGPRAPQEYVPAAPFVAWLEYLLEREDCGLTELSRRLGLPDNLRAYVRGEREQISIAAVEAAIFEEGSMTLQDVYPELYA